MPPNSRIHVIRTFRPNGAVCMGVKAGRTWSLIGEVVYGMPEWLHTRAVQPQC